MPEPTPRDEELARLRSRWQENRQGRVFLQLAEEYRKLERYDDAIAVLEEGLEVQPTYLSARVSLGRCHLEAGAAAAAAQTFERVLVADPTHLLASKLLFEAKLQLGELESCRRRLDIYRLLNPLDEEIDEMAERLQLAGTGSAPPLAAPPAAPPEAAAPASDASDGAGRRVLFPLAPPKRPTVELTLPSLDVAASGLRLGAPFPSMTGGERHSLYREGLRRGPLCEVPRDGERRADATPEGAAEGPTAGADEAAAPEWEETRPAWQPDARESADPADAEPPEASDAAAAPGAPETPPPASAALQAGSESLATTPATVADAPEDLPAAAAGETPALATAPAAGDEPPIGAAVAEEPDEAFSESAPAGVQMETVPELETVVAGGETLLEPVRPATAAPDGDREVAAEPATEGVVAVDPAEETGEAPVGDAVSAGEPADEGTEDAGLAEGGTATLGEIYLRQGHVAEAASIFRRVLSRDPENAAARRGLVSIAAAAARPLAAADLLGEPELAVTGLTERKVVLLTRYLRRLRRGGSADVS